MSFILAKVSARLLTNLNTMSLVPRCCTTVSSFSFLRYPHSPMSGHVVMCCLGFSFETPSMVNKYPRVCMWRSHWGCGWADSETSVSRSFGYSLSSPHSAGLNIIRLTTPEVHRRNDQRFSFRVVTRLAFHFRPLFTFRVGHTRLTTDGFLAPFVNINHFLHLARLTMQWVGLFKGYCAPAYSVTSATWVLFSATSVHRFRFTNALQVEFLWSAAMWPRSRPREIATQGETWPRGIQDQCALPGLV